MAKKEPFHHLSHDRCGCAKHEVTRQRLLVHLAEEPSDINRPPQLTCKLTVQRVVNVVDVVAPAKNEFLFQRFPIFVPSLSW